MSNRKPEVGECNPSDRHLVDISRKFASTSPVIESVAERIAHRWSQGALERHLSIEYRTRRPFIEAVLRREYNRKQAEIARLRMELQQARRAA